MAVYVIGDVQGCYRNLKKLLKVVQFDEEKDRLWFVGDLVNRGPDSLKTLRFVKGLGHRAVTVLGNHDLHLLAVYAGYAQCRAGDTLKAVLKADDCDELMTWLRQQPLVHHDIDLNFAMVHAGIYPGWSLSEAIQRASEVESVLRGDDYRLFLQEMYGNEPHIWSDQLRGMGRLRFITNVFTRMRYLKTNLRLDLRAKGSPEKFTSPTVKPWFEFKQSALKLNRIAFGHWSTLPTGQYGCCFAVDSGCVWGSRLTALRIDKKTPRWYSLPCTKK